MACRLHGTKPLLEPMLGYCRLDPQEQTSVKFELKYKIFICENVFQNVICQIGGHFIYEEWLSTGQEMNLKLIGKSYLLQS